MFWINIFLGACSGTIAALWTGLLVKDGGQKKGVYVIAFLVCFAFLFGIAKQTLAPTLHNYYLAYSIEEHLSNNVAFAALKMHEPETYRLMLNQAKEGLKNGKSAMEVSHQMRAGIPAIVMKRLPQASDEVAFNYMQTNIQEIKELLVVPDDACYRLMFPHSGAPVDVAARIKNETMQEDLRGLAHVIGSAATAPKVVPKLEQIQPFFNPIYQEVSSRYGADMELLSTPQSVLGSRRKVCEIVVDLYGEILALPPSDGGKVIRFLLGPGN